MHGLKVCICGTSQWWWHLSILLGDAFFAPRRGEDDRFLNGSAETGFSGRFPPKPESELVAGPISIRLTLERWCTQKLYPVFCWTFGQAGALKVLV